MPWGLCRPCGASVRKATEFKGAYMSDITTLEPQTLASLREQFDASDANRLAMNAVTAAGIDKVARNYDLSLIHI